MKYKFKNDEKLYRFYYAEYGNWAEDKRILFRVREDRKAKERAEEKGIKYYDRLLEYNEKQFTKDYIEEWLSIHPGHEIEKIIYH